MLLNHLRSACRYFFRQPGYTLLNVAGLSFGLTGFLLIALYLVDELSFDAMHRRADRIYRVVETRTSPEGKETKIASVALNVSGGAAAAVPEVEKTTRIFGLGRANVSDGEQKTQLYEDFFVADQGFLEIFDFPLVEGDRRTALREPYSVIMSQTMATRLFGDQPALGKTLLNERFERPYRVTGVLRDFPSNSHMAFDLLFSEATFGSDSLFRKTQATDWSSSNFVTYFLLREGAAPAKVSRQVQEMVRQHREPKPGSRSTFALQPLRDIHFYSQGIEGGIARMGDVAYVYVFAAVALFILCIACINYMNLATARAATRTKEIGVRKVSGALRADLTGQFLTESLLLSAVSAALALGAVNGVLPAFNTFAGKSLTLDASTDYRIWLGVVVVTVLVGLLSGSYPALLLSGFKPYALLKRPDKTSGGGLQLRRALVVFQFTLSIVMMTATLLVYLQLQYVQRKHLGFDKEHLLSVDINSGAVRKGFETIKTEYAKLAGVKSVTVSSRVPGEWKNLPQVKVKTATTAEAGTDAYFLGVDEDFLKTLNIPLRKGRNFQPGSAGNAGAVLINEAAARLLGITEARNQRITIPAASFGGDFTPLDQPFEARVIGITGDFNYQSLRESIAPMVMAYRENPIHQIDYFTVRLAGEEARETIAGMERVLHSVDAGHLFEYHFLDEQWELFYRQDVRHQQILMVAALGTVLIACLGLFGLASYAAQQRTKEIGIRKVLGASTTSLVALLSRDFLRLVGIAFVLAVPLAWWGMRQWLQNFAYRIELSWWIFALVGLVALLVALLTVSYQALKAATANPVQSLRSE